MPDSIRGKVVNVLDGERFEVTLTHVGKENEEEYQNTETVRLAPVSVAGEPQARGAGRKGLEERLLGKDVRCLVKTRDNVGTILAEVSLVGRGGASPV